MFNINFYYICTKQFVMRIAIRAGELERYIWTVKVLGLTGAPFSKLRQREVEVYAYLNMVYNRYINLGEEEANALTFNKNRKKEICEYFGITIENFYNILVTLRRHGLLKEDKIKMRLRPVNEIVIQFKDGVQGKG